MRSKKYIKTVIVLFFVVCLILITYHEKFKEVWNSVGVPFGYATVVIDPGHGGIDGGANVGTVLEKNITLEISHILKEKLEQQGIKVVMTRESDKDLADKSVKGVRNRKIADLKKRTEIINTAGADVFISIHLNSMPEEQWSGAQVFFNSKNKQNQSLAETLQIEFIKTLKNTDRVAKKEDELYILRQADVPGVLAEVGFLSNNAERQLLQNKAYQKKIASSIEKSIVQYLEFTKNS